MTTAAPADNRLLIQLASDGKRKVLLPDATRADGAPRPLTEAELEDVAGGILNYSVTFPDGCSVELENYPGTFDEAEEFARLVHQQRCPNA